MLCLPTYLDQPNPGLAISMSHTNHRHIVWKSTVRNKHSSCKAPTGAHPAWRTRVQYRSIIREGLLTNTAGAVIAERGSHSANRWEHPVQLVSSGHIPHLSCASSAQSALPSGSAATLFIVLSDYCGLCSQGGVCILFHWALWFEFPQLAV